MSKNDRTEDVKNYLQGLFENGNLDEEKYEELVDSEEFCRRQSNYSIRWRIATRRSM